MLSPLVRRSWAPRGHTPVIKVSDPHGRISVIGAMTISPSRRHFGFQFHLSPDNANYYGNSIVRFIENVRRRVRGPITLLWDSIPIHRGETVNSYLRTHRRIVVEPFPPYAPELNPVDYVWSYVKYGRLPNYCPPNLAALRLRITAEFSRLQKRPDILKSLFDRAGLSLERQVEWKPCERDTRHSIRSPCKPRNARTTEVASRKCLAFDLETAKVQSVEEHDWKSHRPLGISCAATLLTGSDEPLLWHGVTSRKRPTSRMRKREAVELVKYLVNQVERGFTIVTWNGVGFDFNILAEESGMVEACKVMALNHIDMMFHVLCHLGYGISLDSAARGMGIAGKPEAMHAAVAPVLWAQGRRQEVLDYVAHDVRITLKLADICEARKCLHWVTRGGKTRNIPLHKGWLSVEAAMRLPEPDTSWMASQWSRAAVTSWLRLD
jgi:transposase